MTDSHLQTIEHLSQGLAELFDRIRNDSRDGEGVTRDAFGPRETQAGISVSEYAKSQGLEASFDRAGNLQVAPPGQSGDAPEIVMGSHLDSVPVGGNYDGLAGVIAGVGVLATLHRQGATKNKKIRVVGFRGEESPWFSEAYLGSKLLLGQFTRDDLRRLRRYDTGKTLEEHLVSIGGEIPNGELGPTIPLSAIKAYFELHIEQAPLLEHLGRPLGVATAIRGNIRHPFAKCTGHYAHSGAMPRQFRQDALIATARLIAHADEKWKQLIALGNEDLVFTCGIFQTDSAEHAMTKVPGHITFTLNIGGVKNDVMEELQNSISRHAAELEREHKVKFDFGARVGTPAVDLDAGLQAQLAKAGTAIGIEPFSMPTVGHDAAMFQRRGIPSAVLLIRNSHGSHNPKEHMEMRDFVAGTKVLASTILKMSER